MQFLRKTQLLKEVRRGPPIAKRWARAYQESIKIKPTFTYAPYNLALIYSKQDRYQDAIELLRKVVELEPRHTFAQHALGMVYIQTGEKTGAMQQYYLLKNLDSNLAADLLARDRQGSRAEIRHRFQRYSRWPIVV